VCGRVLLRTTSESISWLCLESGALQSSCMVASCSAGEAGWYVARGKVTAVCLTEASHIFDTASK